MAGIYDNSKKNIYIYKANRRQKTLVLGETQQSTDEEPEKTSGSKSVGMVGGLFPLFEFMNNNCI